MASMIRPRPAQSGDDPSTISRQRPSAGPRISRVPPDSGIRVEHRPWRPLPAWRRRRHLNRGLGPSGDSGGITRGHTADLKLQVMPGRRLTGHQRIGLNCQSSLPP